MAIGIAIVILTAMGLTLLVGDNIASLLQPSRLIWVVVGVVAMFWILESVFKRR